MLGWVRGAHHERLHSSHLKLQLLRLSGFIGITHMVGGAKPSVSPSKVTLGMLPHLKKEKNIIKIIAFDIQCIKNVFIVIL